MNNIPEWFQVLVILFLLWFLFFKESFNNTNSPITHDECKRCNIYTFNKNNNINLPSFIKKCQELEGTFIKKNNTCQNYKAKLDNEFRCNCDIN